MLKIISPLVFVGLCAAGVASGALASPRSFVAVSSYAPTSDRTAPNESAADGEVRTMVRFERARREVATARVWTCDVVELAQGNGLVRRCGVQ